MTVLRNGSRNRSGAHLRGGVFVPVVAPFPPAAHWRAVLEVGLLSQPTDDVQTWTDITAYLRDQGTALHMHRGRTEETKQFNAGTLTAILDNRTKRFEPTSHPNVKSEKAVRYSLEYPWLPGMIPNGSFDKPFGGFWNLVGPGANTLAQMPGGLGVSYDGGPGFCRVTANATGETGIITDPFAGGGVIEAGDTYAFTIRMRTSEVGRIGHIQVTWLDNAGGTIHVDDGFTVLTQNVWTRVHIGGALTAPTGAASVTVQYTVTVANATDTIDFDAAVMDDATTELFMTQFLGYADSWEQTWDIGDSICVLTATDGFKVLGFPTLNSKSYIEYITGAAGVPSATWPGPPTHHYRLGESGVNSQITLFQDYITGTRQATSVITDGVGPLYNVAGFLITETDGAFSTVGPSSVDKGYLQLPTECGQVNNTDWTINFWTRAPEKPTHDIYMWRQGDIYGGQGYQFLEWDTTNLLMWIITDVNANFMEMAWVGPGVDPIGFNGTNPYRREDQVPRMITMRHRQSDDTYWLSIDGKLLPNGSGTGLGHPIITQIAPVLGQSRDYYTDHTSGEAEFDEVSIWQNTFVPDADLLNLWTRARRLYPAEQSGARINRILDLAGWPSSLRDIDTGSSTMDAVQQAFSKANPLQYIQGVELSESGWWFMSKDGNAKWVARHTLMNTRHEDVVAVWGQPPAELAYEDVKVVYDDAIIINETEYAMENGGRTIIQQDDASIADFFIRSDSQTALLLTTDAEVTALGGWVLDHFKDQHQRLTNVQLNPITVDTWILEVMLAEIGDRFTVRTRQPGGAVGSYIDYDVRLVGIDHAVKRGKLTVKWDTTTSWSKDYMKFGDVFGQYPMGW